MNSKEYKKISNSQKLSKEINKSSIDMEVKSSLIEEFANSNPELIIELYNRLNDQERVAETLNVLDNINVDKNIKNILQTIDRKNKYTRGFNIFKAVSSIAVAILTISFLVWNFSDNDNTDLQAVAEIESNVSLNTILRLSSGKTYELVTNVDKATEEGVDYIVDKRSKMNIENLKDAIHSDSLVKSEEILDLELLVPEMNKHTVVLPDGSEVILNASSRIKYPEKFDADKREVEIEGEAFFTVKKSNIPFIVTTMSSYVKVYGTTFNINARDDKKVKTTLVSGVVGVGSTNIKEQILKQNQVAVVNTVDGECYVTDVDATNSIGWIEGSIICLDNNLESLFNDLEAWYGIDIRYDNHIEMVKDTKINIFIKHIVKIDNALKLIEKVTDVKFINEGGYYSIEINN